MAAVDIRPVLSHPIQQDISVVSATSANNREEEVITGPKRTVYGVYDCELLVLVAPTSTEAGSLLGSIAALLDAQKEQSTVEVRRGLPRVQAHQHIPDVTTELAIGH